MFRVDWLDMAVDELAELWMRADLEVRRAITEASQELDRRLASNPFRESESRSGSIRIAFALPLAARCRIGANNRVVTIAEVYLVRPPRR